MYDFWYDYVKPKYDAKAKLCYMDTDIVYTKTDDIYKDIEEHVKTRFDTSHYEFDRTLPKGKNKKVIGLMKGSEDKKAKGTKNCVIKRKPKFENHKNCLEGTQLENKIKHLEKSKIDIDGLKKDHKEFIKTIN